MLLQGCGLYLTEDNMLVPNNDYFMTATCTHHSCLFADNGIPHEIMPRVEEHIQKTNHSVEVTCVYTKSDTENSENQNEICHR